MSLADLAYWNPEADDTLVCRQLRDETHDVRTFVFTAPSPRLFSFQPGQFLTLMLPLPGGPVSRSYTISSAPTRPHTVSITVKRVPGGPVSNWLHDHLHPGMPVQAIGPLGDFTCTPEPSERLLFLSAGSGITPLMAMARAQDDMAADTDLVFVHSARSPADIIFQGELALLERHRPGFRAVFVCSADRPQHRWGGHRGRLDEAMLSQIAPDFRERRIFLCGPAGYMAAMTQLLREAGTDMRRVASESFDFARLAADSPEVAATEAALEHAVADAHAPAPDGFSISFERSGRTIACAPDRFVLDAARHAGLRLPFSCAKGVCGSCKTTLVSGTVEMVHGGGIRRREIEAGLVLLCCARPTSDLVIAA